MDRREFLAAVAAAATAGNAGCSGIAPGADRDTTPAPSGTASGGPRVTPRSGHETLREVDLPVPKDALRLAGFKDSIPAIVDPAFADDWSDVVLPISPQGISREFDFDFTPRLADEERVIGLNRDGRARAYPLAVLEWHEVVNDDLGGPLLVTYCPLCGSGVVARRLVNGEPTVFGVSGLLYRSNLVMYDRATESLWSQLLAVAIRGPETGDRLELLPSTLTTWGRWRDAHPDTEVLLPPPKSGTVVGRGVRDYEEDPYPGYGNSSRIGIGPRGFGDDRLPPKMLVVGVAAGGEARAYPFDAVSAAGVINDAVGGLPVVVATDGETLAAYVRRVGGRTLRFEAAGGGFLRADGSRFRIATGEAVSGPHAGTRLVPANDRSPMYWFAWLDSHPETTVYGESG